MKLKSIVLILLLSILGNLFAQNDIKLKKITSFGGTLKNITSKDNNIFISTTDGLKIFDVTDKKNVKLISYINNIGVSAKMDIKGNYLYLTSRSNGLIVVNISNVSKPFIEGKTYFLQTSSVNDKAEANDVRIDGDYAYIAVGKKGLAVVDVSSAKTPKILNYFQINGYTTALDIQNSYAYVVSTLDGLDIVDISNPNKLISIAHLAMDGQCNDIKVDKNYAYIANSKGLQIVDISDPNNPTLVGTFDTNGYCLAVDIKGDYAYIANGTDIQVVDITNKKSPTLVDSMSQSNRNCYDIKVNEDFIYLLNNKEPCVIDISEPYDIKHVSYFDMASLVKKIKIVDKKAYIANDYNGIQIADISDIDNIKLLGEYYQNGIANDVVVKDSTLFVANNHKGLLILDVSNSKDPSLISSVDTGGIAKAIALKDCCVFVANGSAGLSIVNVEDPSNPSVRGTLDAGGNANDVVLKGNYAFIADGYNGLVIIDVSNRDNPQKISQIKLKDFSYSVKVEGNYAYIADGDEGLHVVDISDVNNPKSIGSIDTDGQAKDVQVWNGFAFVSDDDKGVKVIDISDPKNMSIVEKITINGKSLHTYIDDNKLFLSNFSNGVSIFTIIQVPDAVLNLAAKDIKDDQLTLLWDMPVESEIKPIEKIKIFRDGTLVKTLDKNQITFTDKNLQSDTSYTYEIKTSNEVGDSKSKKIDVKTIKAIPAPPTSLSAKNITDNSVELYWHDNSDVEEGFKIFRNSKLIKTTKANVVNFNDSGLESGVSYAYEVKAFNESGNSSSDVITIKTLQSVPASASDFKADKIKSNFVTLSWKDNSDNEDGFRIERDGMVIGYLSENMTSFTDRTVESAKTYKYTLKAINKAGESEGVSIEIKTLDTIPTPPTALEAVIINDSTIKLVWNDNSENENGFEIYKNDKLLTTTSVDVNFYIDKDVTTDILYTYLVQAVNSQGSSAYDKVKVKITKTVPLPVTDFVAIPFSESIINLSWSDNSDNEEGFEIYRDDTLIYKAKADETSYTDKELKPNTLYRYTIRAVNEQGASIFASAKAMTFDIDKNVPNPPVDFRVNPLSAKVVKLQWKDNSDNERGYKIYRDGKLIATLDNQHTSFIDKELEADTNYVYKIVAVNSKGASKPVLAKVKTKKDPLSKPNAPSDFTAVANGDKEVELRWSDNSDNEEGFEIYRDKKLIYTALPDDKMFLDTHLMPGTLYEYEIKAINDIGSSTSVKAQATTLDRDTMIIPPTNLFGEVQSDKYIILRWSDNSDNEDGFKIYRDNELIYTTKANKTQYVDIDVETNRYYTYMVKATNKDGDSISDSVKVSIYVKIIQNPPQPPTNLFAKVKDNKEIVLTWSDNSDDEEGFKIFRNDKLIHTVEANVTTYTDKNLEDNVTIYTYIVKATNKNGDSMGDSIKAQISDYSQDIPASPLAFKAEPKGVLNVKLSWTDSDKNDKKYKIYRNKELIYTADRNESSYVDTTAEPDTEYIYSIVAFNENGNAAPLEAKIKLSINQIQTFVYNLYKKVLERKPDDEGLLYWENELKSKNKTALYVVKQFIKLPEFGSKNIDSKKYVEILYKTFFNRIPEKSGLDYWKEILDKNSYPKDILFYKFAFSNEFKDICEKYGINNYTDKEKAELFIERLYQLVLKRPSDRESLDYWSSLVLDKIETPKNIAKSFFDSDEFKKKKISDEEIITIVYRALLDREPDKEGIDYWKKKLESGMKMDKMLDIFLNSEEFSTLVKKGFVNEL